MARPSDSSEVRRHNASLVLRDIAEAGPTARTEVRRRTGLVSGTVTAIVADLISRGLVVESGAQVSTGGRPQRVVEVAPERVFGLVAGLSREAVRVEVVDFNGTTVRVDTRSYDGLSGGSVLVAVLAALLDEAWEAVKQTPGAWLTTSTLIAPGPVTTDGTLTDSIELGTRDLNFPAELAPRLRHQHRLEVVNNGRLGALAEFEALPTSDRPRAMVYLATGPDGVGGGVVVDGRLFAGEHGFAGEVGHIVVDKSGPACVCGARGCLALYLDPAAMVERITGTAPASMGRRAHGARTLLELAEAGHDRAQEVLTEAGEALAAAIATMSNYTDMGAVVLGGDLPDLEPWLKAPLDNLLTARRAVNPRFNPSVRSAEYGTRAPWVGAWAKFRAAVMDDPMAVSELPFLKG